MPDRILLFIPAYNCEKQVPRVLDQLLDPEVSGFVSGCIVVNNRSTDDTEAAVLSWMTKHPSKPVRLLRNNENYGLGGKPQGGVPVRHRPQIRLPGGAAR